MAKRTIDPNAMSSDSKKQCQSDAVEVVEEDASVSTGRLYRTLPLYVATFLSEQQDPSSRLSLVPRRGASEFLVMCLYTPPVDQQDEHNVPRSTRTHKYYTDVATVTVERNVTRADFVCMCAMLERQPAMAGYACFPEPITEGGLLLRGKYGFKTLRLFIDCQWPWITQTVLHDWQDDDTILYRPASLRTPKVMKNCRVLAKAFSGASGWTRAEMWAVHDVFAQFGLRMKMLSFRTRGKEKEMK